MSKRVRYRVFRGSERLVRVLRHFSAEEVYEFFLAAIARDKTEMIPCREWTLTDWHLHQLLKFVGRLYWERVHQEEDAGDKLYRGSGFLGRALGHLSVSDVEDFGNEVEKFLATLPWSHDDWTYDDDQRLMLRRFVTLVVTDTK